MSPGCDMVPPWARSSYATACRGENAGDRGVVPAAAQDRQAAARARHGSVVQQHVTRQQPVTGWLGVPAHSLPAGWLEVHVDQGWWQVDRKSTRLNSSH